MGKRIGRKGWAIAHLMDGSVLSDSTRHLWRRCFSGFVLIILLSVGLSYAANYVYDGHGRVVAVTHSDGSTSQYVYDSVGNLQQIVAIPAGQLAIFGFSPTHGSPGISVTISGQGFSSAPSNDAVAFNGTTAVVTAATATSLSVTVPSGATTGPISVTVGNQSATSTESFIVDGTGLPPIITSFSPTIANSGTAITLLGQNLYPVAGQTSVAIDGRPAMLASIGNAQAVFPAPTVAGSGHVSVETPYGLAVSSADLIVSPPGITAASVVTEQRISIGGAQSLSIPAAGDYGVLLFDVTSGSWLSFQLSALTTSANNITYTVYDPTNRAIMTGTISAAAPTIHLPVSVLTGTYSIYFQPDTSAAALTLGLEAAQQITINAPTTTLATTVSNQSKRYLFSAAQGQYLAFAATSATTVPAGGSVNVAVYGVSGNMVSSALISGSGSINLPNLSSAVYQVVLSPSTGATEDVMFQLVSNGVVALTADGPSIPVAPSYAGEYAYLNFTVVSGDNLELALSGVATSSSNGYIHVMVMDSNQNWVTGVTCYVASPGICNAPLWGLAGGSYSIIVEPSTVASTMGFTATLTRDVVGALTVGQSTTLNLSRPGQTARLSFSATAGQTLAVAISGMATTPANLSASANVYSPSGVLLSQSTLSAANSAVNLPNLATTGVYTIVIVGSNGVPMSATVTLVGGATGELTIDGASQTFSTVADQSAYLTFTAAPSDNLEFALSGLVSSGGQITATVFDPNGVQIGSQWCSSSLAGGSCNIALWGLTGGVYSIVVSDSGAMNFTATLTRDLVGSLTPGQPFTVSLPRPGQTQRLSFSATAGQTFAIAVANLTTIPAGTWVYGYIYGPNGTLVSQTALYGATTAINLPNVVSTGTYTLIIVGYYGVPTSATITLEQGVTGDLSTGDGSQSFTTVPGQSAYFNFTASAGANLELGLSGVTGSTYAYATVSVYDANNNSIATQNCYVFNPAGSCNLALWGLAGGTYTVTVASNGTTGFSTTLTNDLLGALTLGQSTPISLSLPGETARLSFSGTAGQTMAIAINGMVTTPAGNSAYGYVYNPNGTLLSTTTLTGANSAVNLPNLPATGTYTLIFVGYYGLPTSATMTLEQGVTGSVTNNGSSQGFTTGAGQSVYLSFTVSSGANLEFALSGVTGSSTSYATVTVYDPNNNAVGSVTCYESNPAGSCRLPLWGLAGGTYTVTVASNGTTGFNATLTSDILGTLASGQSTPVSLMLPGATARLSFATTAGQTVGIDVTGMATTPAGNSAYAIVYAPGGAVLTQATLSSASSTINLPNLAAAGTYTLILYGNDGLPMSATVTLIAGVSGSVAVDGGTQSFSTAAGQNAYLNFTAAPGANLELGLSGLTGSGEATVSVIGPSGNSVGTQYCYVSNPVGSCNLQLWGLTGGAYSVTVVSTSTTGFNITLSSDVLGTLTVGEPLALDLSLPGQTARLSFSATEGQTVGVAISSMATTPAGQYAYANVYSPSGSLLTQTLLSTANSTINLPNLAATGTYTVVFYGNYGLPTSANISLFTGVTGSLTTNGATQSFTTASGQTAYLNFTASPGNNLELGISGLTGASSGSATMNVRDANNNSIGTQYCYVSSPAGSCNLQLWALAGGAYTVTVASTGTTGFNAALTSDVLGTLTIGQPVAVNLTQPGQTERLNFSATAGQTVGVAIAGMTTTPVGNWGYVTVYTPSGSVLTQSWVTNANATINLPNLAASGTYTVVFYGNYGLPTSATVSLLGGVTGILTGNGPTQNFSTASGQTGYLSFAASPGDNVELGLSGLTGTSSGSATVSVFDANNNSIGTQYCYVSNPVGSCHLSLWALAGGTYSVTVSSSGTTAFSATLTTDVVNTLSLGQPVTVNLTQPGQTERLTFSATAGQTLAIGVSGLATVPSGNDVYVNVYNPNGTLLKQTSLYSATAAVNVTNLPTTGTYTVIFIGYYGLPASGTLTLVQGAAGVLTTDGSSQTYSTPVTGQIAYLTFTAPAGSNLELGLSEVTGASTSYASVAVYDSNGYYVGSQTCDESSPAGSCHVALWALAGGTYTIPVTSNGSTGFTATLTQDQLGTLTPGQATAVNLTLPGETARLSFSATEGQTATLTTSGLVTIPAGNDAWINVYTPSGTLLKQSTVVNGANTITLSSLAFAGNYTVIVYGYYGLPMSTSLSLQLQ